MNPVVAIRTQRVRVPLKEPFVTALRRTEWIETLAVSVEDGDGLVGWGEAPQVWQVTGDSLAGSEAALAGPFSDVLVGAPADLSSAALVQTAVYGNRAAKMALDVALHDLVARRAGISMVDHLRSLAADRPGRPGGPPGPRTDVTLSIGTPDELAGAAAARVAEGFGTLKIKVGSDAAGDAARVLAVREAVPEGTRLRIDANTRWRADEAVAVLRTLADHDVDLELVEQPVARRDLDAMAYVRRHQPYPVVADESVFDLEDLVDLIRLRAADGVNVKLAKCGGLTPALELLRVAETHGLRRFVGCMMESAIAVSAAAGLVAATGLPGDQDLDAVTLAASSPYVGGVTCDGARLLLPEGPGLGIEGLV